MKRLPFFYCTFLCSLILCFEANAQNNRIPMRDGQINIFANGINIAWTANNNFARDLTNFNETNWATILDSVQSAGGNAVRWWLHTNGSASPLFDINGNVSGLNPQTLGNMKMALDMAYERNIVISMCLWSFDMLQPQGQDQQVMKALLENPTITQTYIDNALIPILQEVGDHPAVMTWEIFNEPEGMTTTFGNCWTPVCTQMIYVQQFINLLSGAIHREVPTALVSNGSWNMRASSDVGNFFNYYSDDRLIAAGGDEDGILDFVQVHFYPQWESNDSSPFHHPASYWGIDKPIIIGEFPAEGLLIGSVNPYYNTENSYDQAYKNGYAGAMSWSWTDVNFGGFAAAREGISFLISTYSNGLVAYDTTWVGPEPPVITGIDFDKKGELNIYPNPANNLANIQFQESSFNYQLINQLGNTIQSGFSQSKETQIDLSGLQKGMYFINVYNSNMSMIRRLIKE